VTGSTLLFQHQRKSLIPLPQLVILIPPQSGRRIYIRFDQQEGAILFVTQKQRFSKIPPANVLL
jgi:hypothetical protein